MRAACSHPRTVNFIAAAVIFGFALGAGAQTRVTAPKNSYSPADDVKLGREAAAQAEQQFPLLRDDGLTNYVAEVGRRLVDAIPAELKYSEFQYSFKVINVREINAFALPGGPMYVNRGMIGAFASSGGRSVFTHGVEAGEAPAAGRDLRSATEGLIASLAQANPGLRRLSDAQSGMVGDKRGLRVVLSNTSDATGQPERLAVYTALLDDGHLFYAVAVAPQEDFNRYDATFSKVISSLRLQNHR